MMGVAQKPRLYIAINGDWDFAIVLCTLDGAIRYIAFELETPVPQLVMEIKSSKDFTASRCTWHQAVLFPFKAEQLNVRNNCHKTVFSLPSYLV